MSSENSTGMTDLHDKARALLAVCEKATPGPWSTYLNSVKSMTVRLMLPDGQEACEIALCRHTTDAIQNAQFIAAAHDMADTIRDLLAENERLTKAIQVQARAVRTLRSAEAALAAADREAAERARKLTDQPALESLQQANSILTDEVERLEVEIISKQATIDMLNSMYNEAESKLRELCEQEPVVWQWVEHAGFGGSPVARYNADRPQDACHGQCVPLIPRPSMPESGK